MALMELELGLDQLPVFTRYNLGDNTVAKVAANDQLCVNKF
ncbi:MAG TPA: hypothetical protein VFQ73_08400 [Flavisolibacter sp.]|nr:hypothetical protein [Flavisolibacter sp.]